MLLKAYTIGRQLSKEYAFITHEQPIVGILGEMPQFICFKNSRHASRGFQASVECRSEQAANYFCK